MQQDTASAADPNRPGFNPHPSRRTGATPFAKPELQRVKVSILTRPGGRVQRGTAGAADTALRVSILTRPGGRVQLVDEAGEIGNLIVSILTRPGGRVQPAFSSSSFVRPCAVSILTRPGGRVQPISFGAGVVRPMFQSSPVPEDGCNAVQPH